MADEVPAANSPTEGTRGWNYTTLYTLGMSHLFGTSVRTQRVRRDMLIDEDTREFGQLYGDEHVQDATDSTTWSLRPFLGVKMPSTTSHEPSITSNRGSVLWREKDNGYASNAKSLSKDDEPRLDQATKHSDYQPFFTNRSDRIQLAYQNPFEDPIDEEIVALTMFLQGIEPKNYSPTLPFQASANLPRSRMSQLLPPMSMRPSMTPIGAQEAPASQSSHTQDTQTHESLLTSPPEITSRVTSHTTGESVASILPRTTSIIGAGAPPSSSVRRSDTWWTRLSSGILDRRSSDAYRNLPKPLEIRDPHPPPMLNAIEEVNAMMHTLQSSGDVIPKNQAYNVHNYSTTSLKTARTMDSEAIEQLVGMMDVVQRLPSSFSRRGTGSGESCGATTQSENVDESQVEKELISFTSPVDMVDTESAAPASTSPCSPPSAHFADAAPRHAARPRTASGAVAAKIQEYERRTTLEKEFMNSNNTRQREERIHKQTHNVRYGLAPRPSLFIANPDKRISRDSSSTS